MIRDYIGLMARNPALVLSPRKTAEYAHAMAAHRKAFPACAYCGRTKAVDVHHIRPVGIAPYLAADGDNMITLCRKPQCHFIVGHMGDWKTFNSMVESTCIAVRLDKGLRK